MKLRTGLVFGLIGMLAIACKKDKVPIFDKTGNLIDEPVDSCYCLPLSVWDTELGDVGIYNISGGPTNIFPQINPNNSDEVAFTHLDSENNNIQSIMIYNQTTGEKRLLVNSTINGYFSWSKKDWVIFQNFPSLNLFKIKSNGDSLTQLTFDGRWFHPEWNNAGDKFIVFKKNDCCQKSYIMDENANILDTITNWAHTRGDWSHPTLYAGIQTNRLVIMNLETNETIKEMYFPDYNTTFEPSIGWVSTHEVYYIGNMGKMYVYNLFTDVTTLVDCTCYQKFSSSTHSSDFSKLIFTRFNQSLLPDGNGVILNEVKLIQMNKDATNQVEIVIP